MTQTEYNRLTVADMKKRRWRTTRPIETMEVAIPAGTEVSVLDKQSGLFISGPKCQHCGVAVRARRVAPGDVEEIYRHAL